MISACGGRSTLESEREGALDEGPAAPDAAGDSAGVLLDVDAAAEMEIDANGPVDADAGQAVEPDTDAGQALAPDADAGYVIPPPVDASLVAPCLAGGNIFVVDGDGVPSVPGLQTLSGADVTWNSDVESELLFQLDAIPPDGGGWFFAVGFAINGGVSLAPGTYLSSGNDVDAVYARVATNSGSCGGIPTGPFTLAEIVYPLGDESHLASLLAWFDLTCPQGGSLRGCVSYGR